MTYPGSSTFPGSTTFPGFGSGTTIPSAPGAPAGVAIEVEFTAGTWTDVTPYVDWSAGLSTKFGRTSPFSQVQPATMNLTLFNDNGCFSAGRQTLNDGTTVHPYWPNVVPLRRIRYRYMFGGTIYHRFTGYVSAWTPFFKDDVRPRVTVAAQDRLARFAAITLDSPVSQEIVRDAPAAYWPLTDGDTNSNTAVERSGGPSLVTRQDQGTSSKYFTFGATGVGANNGTAWTSTGSFNVQAYMQANGVPLDPSAGLTVECWIKPGTYNQSGELLPSGSFLRLSNVAGLNSPNAAMIDMGFTFTPTVDYAGTSLFVLVGDTTHGFAVTGIYDKLIDGAWHHIALTVTAAGAAKLYLDGVAVSSAFLVGGASPLSVPLNTAFIGQGGFGGYLGSLGHVAVYTAALSAARVAAHTSAGKDWVGEDVDNRIARYLTYAGVTSADYQLDDSAVLLDSYPQAGATLSTAILDHGTTEGAGAVLYVRQDGKVRFRARPHVSNTTPVITLDAAADLHGPDWSPAYDVDSLVNTSTGQRSNANGTRTSQVASDASSIATYGRADDGGFTSYALSDDDVLRNAQQRVAAGRLPAFRLNRVTVDLWTAQTPGLYAAVGIAELGSRLRLTSLPTNAGAPSSTLDLIIEGFADTVTDSSYLVAFDTSPADTPPVAVYDTSAWQTDGTSTLSTALTAGATSVVIATAAGHPKFTTDGGAYPLTIRVGVEHIQLNSPPSGSTSPQTFTGATRGADSTVAAAQAAGALVDLAPTATLAL